MWWTITPIQFLAGKGRKEFFWKQNIVLDVALKDSFCLNQLLSLWTATLERKSIYTHVVIKKIVRSGRKHCDLPQNKLFKIKLEIEKGFLKVLFDQFRSVRVICNHFMEGMLKNKSHIMNWNLRNMLFFFVNLLQNMLFSNCYLSY